MQRRGGKSSLVRVSLLVGFLNQGCHLTICLGFGCFFSASHIPRVYTQGGRLTPRPLQALLLLPLSKGGEGSPRSFRGFCAATCLPCGDIEDGKYPLRLCPALPTSCRPALRAAAMPALFLPQGLGAASIPCRRGPLPQPKGQGDAAGVPSCQAGRQGGKEPGHLPSCDSAATRRPPPTRPCGDLAAGGEALSTSVRNDPHCLASRL